MSTPSERFGLAIVVVLSWLAAASADPSAPIAKLEHDGPVNVVTFSPDGKLLAAGDRDSTIRLWNAATGKLVHKMQLGDGEFLSLSFAPDGKTLASTGNDGWIRLWDVEKGMQIREFHARERNPRGYVVFAPDSNVLASGAGDGIVSIWDPATARELVSSKPWGYITSMAFLPNGVVVALGSEFRRTTQEDLIAFKQGVRLIDARSGKEIRSFSPAAICGAVSPDGKTVAADSTGRLLALVEVGSGRERAQFKGKASAHAFSCDSRFLASADAKDHSILVRDLVTGQIVLRLEEHEADITGLAFSPDGKRLASASGDLSVLLWDTSGLAKRQLAEVRLSDAELMAGWEQFAGPDAVKAYQVRNQFVQAPTRALPFLQAKLNAIPLVDAKRLAQLILDLDSKQFAARQKAAANLEELGAEAEAALQKVLDAKPSLEARRRVEDLLQRLGRPRLTAEQLRVVRAVEVLELIGTSGARKVLANFAKPEPPSFLTHEARMAWKRLARRGGKQP